MRKVFTLAIVVKDGRVLLGRKVRKHGQGFWNGFGGNVQADETIEQAALRECEEEVGIIPTRFRKQGVLLFEYPDKPLGAVEHEVHVFKVTGFTGIPTGTDEMAQPTWFLFDQIPYNSMWPDDAYWLPMLLANKHFRGRFRFDHSRKLVWQSLQSLTAAENVKN